MQRHRHARVPLVSIPRYRLAVTDSEDRTQRGGGKRHAPRFGELDFAEARAMLYAKARRHLDPSSAEDVVQTTLVAALEHADSFEGRAKATTWMVGILHRKIVDLYRRRARGYAVSAELVDLDEPASRDPLESLESKRYAARFARAARVLTEREREILGAGLDEEARAEIGASLGLTRSHLRVIWHRAVLKVRAVP